MNKEKTYPQFEEGNDSVHVQAVCAPTANPSAAYSSSNEAAKRLLSDISEIEQSWDNPDTWISSENLWTEINQTFPWATIK